MERFEIATNAHITLARTPSDWHAAFARLAEVGGDDIYFRFDYSALYVGTDGQLEAFIYECEDEIFVLPYVLRPIESVVFDRMVFDFESPYGYGGPLASTNNPAFLAEAWKSFRDMCIGRMIVAGFIRFHPMLDNHCFVEPGFVCVVSDRQTIAISLGKTEDEVWRGYSSDTRNKVRKGQKLGVAVKPATGVDALRIFSGLYEEHMEEIDAHHSYFFGEEYFLSIHALGEDSYRVYLARHNDELLGGALVLLSPRFAHYHLSSSLRGYNSFATNTMLRHAVIQDMLGSGRKMLHFGGGRTPSPDDTLLKFKAGFSPERHVFRFGTFIGNKDAYNQLCDHWRKTSPELVERFGERLLCYRF